MFLQGHELHDGFYNLDPLKALQGPQKIATLSSSLPPEIVMIYFLAVRCRVFRQYL